MDARGAWAAYGDHGETDALSSAPSGRGGVRGEGEREELV